MVTFTHPQWAALIPVVLGAYWLIARSWHKQTARGLYFTGAHVLDEVQRETVQRRWPLILAMLAPVLVAIGLTGPQLAVTVDRQAANVVLVMDTSGSMNATDVPPTRLVAAQNAAKEFLRALPDEWKAALIGFSENPYIVRAPTSNRDDLDAAIGTLVAMGGTATGDALDLAIDVGRAGYPDRVNQALAQKDELADPSQTVIVVLSDGRQTTGSQAPESAAARAARLGIPVFTIAFGTDAGQVSVLDADGRMKVLDVPPDPSSMALIASTTQGQSFTAVTEGELRAVYSSVAARLEPEQDLLDLGAPISAVGLLLGLAAVFALVRHRFVP